MEHHKCCFVVHTVSLETGLFTACYRKEAVFKADLPRVCSFSCVATAMLQAETINLFAREVNPMHLSVLMPQKISSELIGFVDAYLNERGFRREGDYYVSGLEEHFLTITIDKEPEQDLCWTYRTSEVIWFIPMSQIILDSKKTEKSHMLSYETALNLARITQGGMIKSLHKS